MSAPVRPRPTMSVGENSGGLGSDVAACCHSNSRGAGTLTDFVVVPPLVEGTLPILSANRFCTVSDMQRAKTVLRLRFLGSNSTS